MQDCHHTEVVRHNDTARQGQCQIKNHIRKNSLNLNWVCPMAVHTSGTVPHRTVEEEEGRWGTEMVAGGHWEDKSEEDKVVVPQHGALVEVVVVEMDSWMDVMVAAVEEHEVVAEGIGDVGSVDIADVELHRAEDAAAAIKEVGIAD